MNDNVNEYSCFVITRTGRIPFVYSSSHRARSAGNIEDAKLSYQFDTDTDEWFDVDVDSIYRI